MNGRGRAGKTKHERENGHAGAQMRAARGKEESRMTPLRQVLNRLLRQGAEKLGRVFKKP